MKIILILAILFVFIFFSLMETEKPKKTETNSKTTTDTTSVIDLATKRWWIPETPKTPDTNSKNKKTTVSAPAVNFTPSRWTYSTSEDRMDGSKMYFAHLISTNMVVFKDIYTQKSWFKLMVRNMNKKNEVILEMNNELAGQFMPSLYSPYETCRVKFDENSPVNFGYVSPNNGNSVVISFINSQKFIANLKKAEKLMIECEFYRVGRKIIEFNVNGLEWNR